jgi:transposase
VWENLLVAIRFRPVERDQSFLLPPDMSDWLGVDHVVWFLLDVVAAMDLTTLYERAALRRDGQRARNIAGRAAYDPEMLLALLIYGYACGERSSRQIERLCHTDVAFRLICAGDIPDHTVIARFRQAHAGAFAELFAQVLLLCKAAGLVKLCTVAIDGSKIAANASKQANRCEEWLRTEAEKAADRSGDGGVGDAEALAAAEAALVSELATRLAAQHAWEPAWEHANANPGAPVPRGRAPKPAEEAAVVVRARTRVDKARTRVTHPETTPRRGGRTPDPDRRGRRDRDPEPRANLTDPDSTIMPTKDGWIQGYNTQFAITADQIILATEVSTNPADILSYDTMVAATVQAAAALGEPDGIGTLLLDTGYASNATLAAPGPDRLIALGKSHSVQARAREHPTTGEPPPDATAREAMDHRLRTDEGAKLYKRRGATVEPGIGNFKKLLDRYSLRGLAAVTAETCLAALTFNLCKIHRAAPT